MVTSPTSPSDSQRSSAASAHPPRATRLASETAPVASVTSELDTALQSAASRELVARVATAIGAVYSHKPDSLEIWLDGASAAMAQFIDGFAGGMRLSGVWIACVSQDSMSAPPAVNVGLSGLDARANVAQLRESIAGWCSSARLTMGLPSAVASPSDGPRLDAGQALVRCTLPLRWAGNPRWLICEVCASSGDAPGKSLVAAVELMLPLLAGALEQGFARVETHRQRLLLRVSPAQQPIMPHLATGKSQRQIALIVGRSLHTVHDHVKSIYSTLGVSSRYQFQRLWNGLPIDASDGGDDE